MAKKLKLCGSLVGTLYKRSTKLQIFAIIVIVKNSRPIKIAQVKVQVNLQVTNYRPLNKFGIKIALIIIDM